MNILEKIANELDTFSKSERKVAEVILSSPGTVIHASIAALAKQANISEPTVNRFCRRLMLTKMTLLMNIPQKYSNQQWLT